MLSHLHIQDFAIAPELDVEFHPGFTVITGETGAGKSILVDALGLLLGDRSDASWVRAGAERAELSADFGIGGNQAARRWLQDAELASGDQCLLRRSIAANGRSRAWINGTAVTIQQLAELGELLVELHGQNEHLALTRPREQLRLLDACGNYAEELQRTAGAYRDWKSRSEDFAQLEASTAIAPAEAELLRYQHEELQAHALPAAELRALEEEHRLLSHSGELLATLSDCLDTLDRDDGGILGELHRVQHRLRGLQDLDRGMAEAGRMLEEAAINIQETAGSLRHALDRVDLSPERLAAVRSQLDRLGDLARKHQLPMEQLASRRDELGERLERSEHYAERRARLRAEVAQALADYRAAADALSQRRRTQAEALSERVTGLMAELGMADGIFRLETTAPADAPPSPQGSDRAQILVSANPGMPAGPLAKIASGGELSRISLAIKVATARGEQRTQVFDEVDAGIGGDTANTVGRLLQRLAADGQALCVTHLAQVAARANRQLRVDKQTVEGLLRVDTRLLDEAQRIAEIARMLSGSASEQSLAHARELLKSNSPATREPAPG
jgi:DNA repair protein RecN (Recombination protein N)